MSTRYPGGLITKTPVVPTINSAPGVWTLEQALVYIKAGTWPGGVTIDPYFNQTTLLLHGDGTNGAQNNTFLDSSTNNFTITRNGNTTQGTFSPFSLAAGQWSNYFDGSGDYLTYGTNSAFSFGTGDFTVEAWVYLTAANLFNIFNVGGATTGSYSFYWNAATSKFESVRYGDPAGSGVTTNTYAINQWYHVVASRVSGTARIFVNGVVDSGATYSMGNCSASDAETGRAFQNPSANAGYISNLRVVKGSGVTSVTVPTTPLTAISGTSLLTCQSNRFVDNSTNAFTITRNGDVRVTPFSPFAPTAAYSAGTNGGSGYFDGTGDYLTVANTTALDLPGDFTVEFFVYFNSTADQTIVAKWQASNYAWAIQLFSGNLRFFPGNSGVITATSWSFAWSPTVGQFYHVALTRTSGSVRAYINGTQSGSTITETRNLTSTATTGIGLNLDAGGIQPLNGYLANLRVVKGTSLSSGTTYPVPTAPLTAITNTSLLLNFTNAGIFDNTGKNNLETVGNAQIDTAVKKYGTGSMKFDGTGDYLQAPDTDLLEFGNGNFTVEAWVNFTALPSTSGFATVVGKWDNSTQKSWLFYFYNNAGSYQLYFTYTTNGSTNINPVGNVTIATGTWYHVAACRSGADLKLFLNGTQVGSTHNASTDTIFGGTYPIQVGGAAGQWYLNGYIDDLRITKGVARYTANFTPPTAAFPNQ